MERHIDMNEISDGRKYGLNDMVKVGCEDCAGCSACCHAMGNSIVLDPCDAYRLTTGLGVSFQELLAGKAELHVVDGVILPSLSMNGEGEACAFLNREGRCSIHPHRPGICRLFPLGRFYEDGSFWYFLQVHECRKENRSKVKVRRWLDTPQIKQYEEFVNEWHYFLKRVQKRLRACGEEEERELNLFLVKLFYLLPYEGQRDFYGQFGERMEAAVRRLGPAFSE